MLKRYFALGLLIILAGQISLLNAEEKNNSTTTCKHCQKSGQHNTVEPQPPQILELAVNDKLSSNNLTIVDLAINQTLTGNMRLSIEGDDSLKFKSNQRKKNFNLRKGNKSLHEQINIDTSNNRHRILKIRLELLNDKGEVWLVQSKELEFNKPPQDPKPSRVAVIITQPNGKSIVQYMNREQAEKIPNAKIVEPKAKGDAK